MSQRVDELTQALVDSLNALIGESQRLRAGLEQQLTQPPFWPDRRRHARAFGEAFDRSPEDGQ
jgi:hypothetical protein